MILPLGHSELVGLMFTMLCGEKLPQRKFFKKFRIIQIECGENRSFAERLFEVVLWGDERSFSVEVSPLEQWKGNCKCLLMPIRIGS
jgi:hypothetical protein